MFRRLVVFLSGVLILCLAAATGAQASTARRASLMANVLFLDDTDLFVFPGGLPFYTNRAMLDLGMTEMDGSAGILLGKSVSFGAFFNRDEQFINTMGVSDDLSEIRAVYSGYSFTAPPKIADLFFGYRLDETSGFGVGLTVAHGISLLKDTGGDETGSQSLSATLIPGYSIRKANLENDSSLELTFNYFKTLANGQVVFRNTDAPSVSVANRTIYRLQENTFLGVYALFTVRNYGARFPALEQDAETWRVGFDLRAGPRFHVAQRLVLGATVNLAFDHLTSEVDGADAGDRTDLLLPGFSLAMEVTLKEYLLVRGGVDGRYTLTLSDEPALGESTATGQSYLWSSGLTLRLDGFDLDAVISAPLYTSGPDFIGGGNPGLFSLLSATYRF